MRKTIEDFIKDAQRVHRSRYDYSRAIYVNNTIKVEIGCPDHGVFLQTPNSHLSGNGCRICGIEKRASKIRGTGYDTAGFVEKVNEVHKGKYDYSKTTYTGWENKITIICPDHGEFQQLAQAHARGQGCPVCARTTRARKKILTEAEIIERFRAVHGNRYDYNHLDYQGWSTPVCIGCRIHGNFFQLISNHEAGQNCPACLGRATTTEGFVKKANLIHGNRYDYSKVAYVSSQTPVSITCPTHGDFKQIPNSHLRGSGCPGCFGTPLLTTEQFIKRAKQVHGDRYDYSLVNYRGMEKAVIIICRVHGEFSQQAAVHVNQGCGCQKCACVVSAAQTEITHYLRDSGLTVLRNNRKLITPFELDIIVPENRIAIEYCGLYWHSEISGSKSRSYHLNKLRQCEAKGYRLITIFEDEYLENSTLVLRKLSHIMGISKEPKVFARSCEVRLVTPSECGEFLTRNHLQGPGRHTIGYGLFRKTEMVAVMTFGTPNIAKGRHNTPNTYEMVRYATSCRVPGGAGRLLQHFVRQHQPTTIYTYADRRWSTGNLYEGLGFTKIRTTDVNYWYIDRQSRKHRFSLRKNPQDDPSLSEWENRRLQGWDRIWDCGHLLFEKTYKGREPCQK